MHKVAGQGHYAARSWPAVLLIMLGVILANLGLWRLLNPTQAAPDVPARIAGLAYNAFQRWDSPLTQQYPDDTALADDLRRLAPFTGRLRSYSAAEFPALPRLAAAAGLRLTLGLWLDRRSDNNAREISAALTAVQEHPGIERVIAGNETQLHRKLEPTTLYAELDYLRQNMKVPVSTAEPWHVWLDQPELASHVDFITVHLLPYWEGVPVSVAIEIALRRFDEVQARFPGKPVVIGEIGWPSGGPVNDQAQASPAAQAGFTRAWLAHPRAAALDYFLMEAIDQPWKRVTEGPVGPHWGFLDARRQPKYGFSDPLESDPYWRNKAVMSSLAGLLAMLPFLVRFRRMRLAGRIAFAAIAQSAASLAVLLATQPLVHYLGTLDILMLAVLVPALLIMATILLAQSFEFVELFWPGSLHRRASPQPLPLGATPPLISIHLACSNEPPAMVIAAIDSLRALDWPALEILVIDNNTGLAQTWQPVAAHVENLAAQPGHTIRFFHLPNCSGYKAGALNFAFAQTDPRAAWIGVVDADYVVKPDWLCSLAGYLGDRQVGIVQAPQAHRDWQCHPLGRMMNWEYEGFFRIGMHHRHERDAIIQHGTMTLIRAAALRSVGGWDEECIVEDSELGLRLLERGLRAVYVDQVQGTGLVPADFAAYGRQRRRWAQGAMQILRKHAGALFIPTPGRAQLSLGQRYHFIAGWLPWIGDALHLVFSFAAMVWSLAILLSPQQFGPPLALFAVPLTVFFLSRLLMGPLLYWRCVGCTPLNIVGAALAGMGLSHSVARGVMAGLTQKNASFEITRRPAAAVPPPSSCLHGLRDVREEAGLLLGLLACMLTLGLQPGPHDSARWAWIGVLGMQALPYVAALACVLTERLGSSKKVGTGGTAASEDRQAQDPPSGMRQ